jgi:sulfofructosephosphate aldolase
VSRTVELAAAAGVASLVEGIVRPDPGTSWASPAERHEAILACGAELTSLGPDVYKVEVPGYLPGDVSLVQRHSQRMSEIVGGDWVVLSNGVEREWFAAVTEACKGGASGFLAGRAIWADTVNEPDIRAALSAKSVARLTRLTEIVDGHPGASTGSTGGNCASTGSANDNGASAGSANVGVSAGSANGPRS